VAAGIVGRFLPGTVFFSGGAASLEVEGEKGRPHYEMGPPHCILRLKRKPS